MTTKTHAKATAHEMPLDDAGGPGAAVAAPPAPKKRGRKPNPPIPYGGPSFGLAEASVVEVPLVSIDAEDQTFQFRLSLKTKELADSIRTHGVLVPVTLRSHPTHEGKYQVISGFQRVQAGAMVGLNAVPAIVRDLTDEEAFIHAYAENDVRKSFRDLDRAVGIAKVRKEQGKTTAQIAQLFRLSDRHVQRLEALLAYEDELVQAMDNESLETTHAMVLHQAKRKNPELDLNVWIERVVVEQPSVEVLKEHLKEEVRVERVRGAALVEKGGIVTINRARLAAGTKEEREHAANVLRALLAGLDR